MSTGREHETARILMVDPDAPRRAQLAARLADAGFSIDQIASGFAALTSIERTTPDLVLMRWNAGEMTAVELCSAIRTDASLGQLKAVLVLDPSERVERGAINGSFDLVVEGTRGLPSLLLDLVAGFASERPPVVPAASDELPFAFSGTGAFIDVTDIFQLVGARHKSGILTLSWQGEHAQVLFDGGTVRHARFRDRQGRPAVLLLFATLRGRGGASFDFQPVPSAEGLAAASRTICKTAQQLLIDVAVALDEDV